MIILRSTNGQIKLFDLSNGQMLTKTFKSRHHQDPVHSLLLIHSNNELVSGTSDLCGPHILSLKTGQCLKRLDMLHKPFLDLIKSHLFLAQNELVCSLTFLLKVWDLNGGKFVKVINPIKFVRNMNI